MNDMESAILQLVQDYDNVSFSELSEKISGFDGDRSLECAQFKHIIYWTGISDEACDAIENLLSKKLVFLGAATTLTYMLDGGRRPNYPIAKNARNYAAPRWLPIVLTRNDPNNV